MLGRVILFAAGAYVIAFGWSFATIAFPETCHGPACFVPALGPDTVVDIRAFVSMQEHLTPGSDAAGVWSASGVRLYEQMNATLTIPIPREVRRENASLWLHIFVYRRGALDATPDPAAFQPVPPLLVARTALVAHLLPYSSRDYLLQGSSERAAAPRLPVPHYRYGGSALRVRIVQDEHKHRSHVLACGMLLRALPDRRAYMPYFYVDDFNVLRRHAREMSPELDRPHPALTLEWLPRSLLAHRVISHAEDGFTKAAAMMRLGPEDMDDLRELFGEERLYRLALEQLFGWTHMVLAYLAFSSDVGFFRGRQNVAGLSARSLGSSALSSLIILLYLWDGEDVNRVILYSSTLDFGLQSWKLWTVWRARALTARRFAAPSTGDASRDAARAEAAAREAATESFDALGASVLGHALAPLAVGLALYTLIMYPHKSWWSWLVGAAAKCVYLFGFVGMTPQLFVNYKLKCAPPRRARGAEGPPRRAFGGLSGACARTARAPLAPAGRWRTCRGACSSTRRSTRLWTTRSH